MVPVNVQLLRFDGPWVQAKSVRMARSTIIVFRSDQEFVEFHCWLIEQPDTTLYISSTDPHVTIVGKWTQYREEIRATRKSIARSVPFAGPTDPLCAEKSMTFRISGTSVIGNAGGARSGAYTVVTRFVAPLFESYVKEARASSDKCAVD